METNIFGTCPKCGAKMDFDHHISKSVCTGCGKIWSYDIDFDKGKIYWREWHVMELPSEEWQQEWREKYKGMSTIKYGE